MAIEDLLAQLRASRTDLARIVEAASRTALEYIVVPAGAVQAWAEREPSAWGKAQDWLAAHGKSVVEVPISRACAAGEAAPNGAALQQPERPHSELLARRPPISCSPA